MNKQQNRITFIQTYSMPKFASRGKNVFLCYNQGFYGYILIKNTKYIIK